MGSSCNTYSGFSHASNHTFYSSRFSYIRYFPNLQYAAAFHQFDVDKGLQPLSGQASKHQTENHALISHDGYSSTPPNPRQSFNILCWNRLFNKTSQFSSILQLPAPGSSPHSHQPLSQNPPQGCSLIFKALKPFSTALIASAAISLESSCLKYRSKPPYGSLRE